MKNKPKLISVVGTTASGKSSLGIDLALRFGGEVISADSRQVYRHLDLGTGKVTPEEMSLVKHHLIDIIDLGEPFSMAEFQSLAYDAIDGVIADGKLPMLVGGTGLYTRSVVEGYSLSDVPPNDELRCELEGKSRDELLEILASYGKREIPQDTSERRMIRMIEKLKGGADSEAESSPRYDVLQLGITYPREILNRRILERLDMRIKDGMIDEVRRVMSLGATPELLENLGLEYRYTYRFIAGLYPSFEDYHEELYREICRFAKRQMTWFRKEKSIVWLDTDGDMLLEASRLVEDFLNK